MSDIEERVKKIVAEQLGVKEDIANDSSFVDDLGAVLVKKVQQSLKKKEIKKRRKGRLKLKIFILEKIE